MEKLQKQTEKVKQDLIVIPFCFAVKAEIPYTDSNLFRENILSQSPAGMNI